jgi:hypothetical protein
LDLKRLLRYFINIFNRCTSSVNSPDEVGPTGGTGKWFEIVGFSPIGPNDNVEITDAIRIGDVVYFERIAPEEIVLRVLILEKAGDYVGKKYRIERSDRPGALTLIELTY